MATSADQTFSIVYSSTANHPLSDTDLAALLTTSRRNNARVDVTGLLLYRQGRFLQVLEGPEAGVRDRFRMIESDARHTDVRVLVEDRSMQRQFPDWTMAYEPITTAMAADIPGYGRSFDDMAGVSRSEDLADTIRTARALIHWFQDRSIPLL
ncbi:BLUF domain-containing protein [Arthrobacter sp. Soc17.1.1.1]|uniref:BLUF domain-containing protein n=1 Tax=Arthrobacter sp. Soc17.1.1.1 TaxID=3121277 RepID=UPI002FE4B961